MLLCFSLFGCGEEPAQKQFIKSSAELDQAYIPVLLLTKMQKQRESEISFQRFKNRWNGFYETYYSLELKYGVDIKDALWQEDFDQINAYIVTAEVNIKDKKLLNAYDNLDGVRETLKELRSRHGMNYFMDDLLSFGDLLDEMQAVAAYKITLNKNEILKLSQLDKAALEDWKTISKKPVDAKLFGLSKEKTAAVKERIKLEKGTLVNLETALAVSSPQKIIQSVADIQPNFVMLLKAFGDFQPILDQVKKERAEKDAKTNNQVVKKTSKTSQR